MINNKPFLVLQGPVATRSGYGNHTRDLALALIRQNKYDIQIVSMPWGVTPMNALEDNNEDHNEIIKRIATQNIIKNENLNNKKIEILTGNSWDEKTIKKIVKIALFTVVLLPSLLEETPISLGSFSLFEK